MNYFDDPLLKYIKLKLLTNSSFYAKILLFNIKNSMKHKFKLNTAFISLPLIFSKRYLRVIALSVLIAILSFQMVIPQTQAKELNNKINGVITQLGIVNITSGEIESINQFPNTFPKSEKKPLYSRKIMVSAYNSLVGQTDSTPCLAARGYNLCEANEENVIAANFLPMGTKVRFPELFGDKEFTVVDRMNARYYHKADFWMRDYNHAIQFGTKYTTIEVYEYR